MPYWDRGDGVRAARRTTAIAQPLMGDGAARRLADQTRVFGERAGAMPRLRRLPGLPPRSEFLVIDQEIHEARTGIDPDAVSVVHKGQRAADERFRRDIADAHPRVAPEKRPSVMRATFSPIRCP